MKTIEIKLTWKEARGQGRIFGKLGNLQVFAIFWNGLKARNEAGKDYVLASTLPGTNERFYAPTINSAKETAVKLANHHLIKLGLSKTEFKVIHD